MAFVRLENRAKAKPSESARRRRHRGSCLIQSFGLSARTVMGRSRCNRRCGGRRRKRRSCGGNTRIPASLDVPRDGQRRWRHWPIVCGPVCPLMVGAALTARTQQIRPVSMRSTARSTYIPWAFDAHYECEAIVQSTTIIVSRYRRTIAITITS
jgi:hypothetical protein